MDHEREAARVGMEEWARAFLASLPRIERHIAIEIGSPCPGCLTCDLTVRIPSERRNRP